MIMLQTSKQISLPVKLRSREKNEEKEKPKLSSIDFWNLSNPEFTKSSFALKTRHKEELGN